MRPPPNLSLQRRRRRPWLALAASVAVHALFAVVGWVEGWVPDLPHRPPQIIVLAPARGPEVVDMRFDAGKPTDGRTGRQRPTERRSGVTPAPRRPAAPRPRAPQLMERDEPQVKPDTGDAPLAPRRPVLIGRIRPELGEGQLWVRPLPLPPKELAKRLSRSQVELVDSAVTSIVQGYLDSIAADPASRSVGLPSWTKEIAGRKFGLDSKNIYIAGLKIPAAVLALLPIPAGNIDQNKAYNHLMDLRADLEYAAQRAATMDEFKEAIRQMRIRKEREREFERNQRTPPDSAAQEPQQQEPEQQPPAYP